MDPYDNTLCNMTSGSSSGHYELYDSKKVIIPISPSQQLASPSHSSYDCASSDLSPSSKSDVYRQYSTSPAMSDLLRVKKSKFSLGSPFAVAGVATAARRNERERNRVKMVNMGFSTLRQHVPNGAKNKKMSKVDTLRSAVDYIRQLQKLLGESSELSTSSNENCGPSPSNSSSPNSGDSTSYPMTTSSSIDADADSSPLSSTSPTHIHMDASSTSYSENDDRFRGDEDDLLQFKWY